MKVTIWGSRGSIASAGPETVRYGGNTSSVEVSTAAGSRIFLDAGTGIRRPGAAVADGSRVDLLLSHLHMDHIQGLGFFAPFFSGDAEVHVWGPPSTTAGLRSRLTRYLSPPLFPVRVNELPSRVSFHDAPDRWEVAGVEVRAAGILHPGPTVGYRLTDGVSSVAYLPDHEPALGGSTDPRWTSGFDLAAGVDVLLHDGQYTSAEYAERVGFGHSSVEQAVEFAERAAVKQLVLFHHDPEHDDLTLDRLLDEARAAARQVDVAAAHEGDEIQLSLPA